MAQSWNLILMHSLMLQLPTVRLRELLNPIQNFGSFSGEDLAPWLVAWLKTLGVGEERAEA